jgi:hypothetical protein
MIFVLLYVLVLESIGMSYHRLLLQLFQVIGTRGQLDFRNIYEIYLDFVQVLLTLNNQCFHNHLTLERVVAKRCEQYNIIF